VAATVGNFFSAHLPLRAALIGPVAIGFGLFLALGAIYLRRRLALLAFLVTMMAAPFIGELLVSLRRPIFYDRTLIWTTIPLFLLLAAGLLQLRYRPYILGGLAFIVAVNAVSLQQYFTRFEKEQWREAAAHVAGQVRKDDLLLFNATWVQIPFDFYFHDANRPVEERGAPVDLFDRGILEPKMARTDLPRLRELIRGRERVWLIYSHNWYTDPQNLIPNALGEELRLLEEHPFVGLDVRLYGAPK
jgi:type IV secretory pathway VirB2 component (pilin)